MPPLTIATLCLLTLAVSACAAAHEAPGTNFDNPADTTSSPPAMIESHAGTSDALDTNLQRDAAADSTPPDSVIAGAATGSTSECTGPYVVVPPSNVDQCDLSELDPNTFGLWGDVESVEACFELCAADPQCRQIGRVAYKRAARLCHLSLSCEPTLGGSSVYRAEGGCRASEQCFEWELNPEPYKYPTCGAIFRYEPTGRPGATLEACIELCEKDSFCSAAGMFNFAKSTPFADGESYCSTDPCEWGHMDEFDLYFYRKVPCPAK